MNLSVPWLGQNPILLLRSLNQYNLLSLECNLSWALPMGTVDLGILIRPLSELGPLGISCIPLLNVPSRAILLLANASWSAWWWVLHRSDERLDSRGERLLDPSIMVSQPARQYETDVQPNSGTTLSSTYETRDYLHNALQSSPPLLVGYLQQTGAIKVKYVKENKT